MKFWKDNRLDQEYTVDNRDIITKFLKSKWHTDWEKGELCWPVERRLAAFLSEEYRSTWDFIEDGEDLVDVYFEMTR